MRQTRLKVVLPGQMPPANQQDTCRVDLCPTMVAMLSRTASRRATKPNRNDVPGAGGGDIAGRPQTLLSGAYAILRVDPMLRGNHDLSCSSAGWLSARRPCRRCSDRTHLNLGPPLKPVSRTEPNMHMLTAGLGIFLTRRIHPTGAEGFLKLPA